MASTLIVFGLVLGLADRVARNARPLGELTLRHALVFGFAQALALIPGVSRSGGTISAGLLLGYRRVDAAKYSFLLAIPADVPHFSKPISPPPTGRRSWAGVAGGGDIEQLEDLALEGGEFGFEALDELSVLVELESETFRGRLRACACVDRVCW